MSDELAQLVISLIGAALILTIAILIRVRGPVGLVKGVDFTRVSDLDGLAMFASLVMSGMGALIAAHGAMVYAFHADRSARNIGSIVFVALMAVLAIVLLVGQQRFQDLPRHNGAGRDGRR
jgi:hypothetical protein